MADREMFRITIGRGAVEIALHPVTAQEFKAWAAKSQMTYSLRGYGEFSSVRGVTHQNATAFAQALGLRLPTMDELRVFSDQAQQTHPLRRIFANEIAGNGMFDASPSFLGEFTGSIVEPVTGGVPFYQVFYPISRALASYREDCPHNTATFRLARNL